MSLLERLFFPVAWITNHTEVLRFLHEMGIGGVNISAYHALSNEPVAQGTRTLKDAQSR